MHYCPILLYGFGILFSLPLNAQQFPSWEAGMYYIFKVDQEFIDNDGAALNLQGHFFNINGRIQIAKRWKIGVEAMMARFGGTHQLDNPYSLAGIHTDYALIHGSKAQFNIRAGVSVSNMFFVGTNLPRKVWEINRILGGSLDMRLSKHVYLQAGYCYHMPLRQINFKRPLTQPILGIVYRF